MTVELASVRATVDREAQAVWDMLMDFGHPERLAPTVECIGLTGEGAGAVRIVKSARGFEFHEKLVECDLAAYRFRYAILDSGDMPFAGVASYDCTVSLTPLSNSGTEVFWRSEGDVVGPVEPIRDFLTALYVNAIKQIELQIDG